MTTTAHTLVIDLAVALVALVGVRLAAPAVLRRLPEPSPPAPQKTPYAALATPGFVWAIAGGAAVTCAAAVTLPAPLWPAWLTLGTVGTLIAAIDARTTWLPRQLTWAGWAATPVAALTLAAAGRAGAGITVVLAALGCGALFWLIWRVSASIGFGDVRLMPMLGAAAGTLGWEAVWTMLLAGTALGAVLAVLLRSLGRAGPFPYAPPLIAGAWVALAAHLLG